MVKKAPIVDDPPENPPAPPPPATPETTADNKAIMEMLTAIKGDTAKNTGILAGLTAASALPAKIDEMIEHIKGKPGGTTAEAMTAFTKILTTEAEKATEADKDAGPSLSDRIFGAITFGQFDKKE